MPDQTFNSKHTTHKETLIKFSLLLVVLLGYFVYLSFEYGLATGGAVAAISWSFFVLCTPIADAGFLLDFPIRLLFNIRMIFIEMGVWVVAISMNVMFINVDPSIYQRTALTSIFHKILTTPWPYWSIIVLCCTGTFISIYFGDEMLDVIKHEHRKKHHQHYLKYKIIASVAIFVGIFLVYRHLIEEMGIQKFL